MRIYSHLSFVVAYQGAAMGFNDRLEGCVVEVAVCNPTWQLAIPYTVVAYYIEVPFLSTYPKSEWAG